MEKATTAYCRPLLQVMKCGKAVAKKRSRRGNTDTDLAPTLSTGTYFSGFVAYIQRSSVGFELRLNYCLLGRNQDFAFTPPECRTNFILLTQVLYGLSSPFYDHKTEFSCIKITQIVRRLHADL